MDKTSVLTWISNRVITVLTIAISCIFFIVVNAMIISQTSAMTRNLNTIPPKHVQLTDTFMLGNDTVILDTLIITNDFHLIDSVAKDMREKFFIDTLRSMKTDLIAKVNGYIKGVAPRSKMSGENIVDLCIKHDFDITLLLAQGHLETHFGTYSNSCFGVSGRRHRHRHPDDSVEEYIILMKQSYISRRTTEQALAANMNKEGSKKFFYSESSNYGKTVAGIRRKIIKRTDLKNIFDNYKTVNEMLNSGTFAEI